MFKGKQKSISDAVANGEAGWAIDADLLRQIRREGCSRIAIFLKDNADMYLTPLDSYFKDGEYEQVPWSREYRQARRLVKLDKFTYLPKPVKV